MMCSTGIAGTGIFVEEFKENNENIVTAGNVPGDNQTGHF
jgi:hypothetical protein